jgi:TniQ
MLMIQYHSKILSSFPIWEINVPDIPPRSPLYNLVPLGLGGPFVESLTGYICRLAYEHHIHTGTMLQHIIAPLISKHYIAGDQSRNISSFLRYATPINGNGVMASDWANVLALLTSRNDLSQLTMFAAANAISHRDLLQSTRKWCSTCYSEWQQQHTPIYEPLLWSINGITVCPKHYCLLEKRCQHCLSYLPWLAWRSRPGYCSFCDRWLGNAGTTNQIEGKDIYIAEMTGNFLAYISSTSASVSRDVFVKSLSDLISVITEGNVAAFARCLELPKVTLWELVQGRFPPSLPFLFRLCLQFRLSLLQLLVEMDNTLPTSYPPEMPGIKKDSRRFLDRAKVRQALEEILSDQQQAPVSMQAVARRLGHHARTISTHFPEHCRTISLRYKEYRRQQGEHRKSLLQTRIHEAALIVQNQGMNLTYQRVGAVLGKPGCFREHEMRRAFLDVRQQLDKAVSNHDRGHKKI